MILNQDEEDAGEERDRPNQSDEDASSTHQQPLSYIAYQDQQGNTLLHLAARHERLSIIELLI